MLEFTVEIDTKKMHWSLWGVWVLATSEILDPSDYRKIYTPIHWLHEYGYILKETSAFLDCNLMLCDGGGAFMGQLNNRVEDIKSTSVTCWEIRLWALCCYVHINERPSLSLITPTYLIMVVLAVVKYRPGALTLNLHVFVGKYGYNEPMF